MVLSGTVRGSDPRARLLGRDDYIAAGGRIERELFDDHDSESWVDVALLESLAAAKMEEQAKALAAEQGLAWVKPTLDPYASHDLVEGLVRLPAEPAPLTEAELARLDELDASYDEHAAILEDEDSADEAVAAAEAAIEAIERECQEIRARPPVIAPELKAEAGMVLVLARDGTPVLQPVFYGERQADPGSNDGGIEVVPADDGSDKRRTTLSKRLVDELAMQRRDVLALHVASDPGLALDIMVFTLADADTHDWRARPSTTLRAPVPAGPIIGFEAKDAPASSALAELRSGLDESWRAGDDATSRFDLFRALPDDSRAAWLGYVVARSHEASLNMSGERQLPFQDHLGRLIGIDMAQWWRPTAANYFDRVSKQVILDALTVVGGLELSSRFAAVKKGDLAMSAERIFAGTYITEVEVREKAVAWVPEVMRFASAAPVAVEPGNDTTDAEPDVDSNDQSTRELAA
jgi:ParB family chromosome partitioning protein